MEKYIWYLTLLIISGCNSKIMSFASPSACPEKPVSALKKENVEKITLNNKILTKSGQANANKSVGYKFAAKSGKKLSYSTNADICIWVYTPDNQILNGRDLTQNGTYIIQVSAPKGSKTFDLNMSLGTLEASSVSTPSTGFNFPFSILPSRADLTKEEAVQVLKRWYAAKSQIFAPPYNTKLVGNFTIGKLHKRTVNPNPKIGSVAWLRANKSYYTYSKHQIKNVIDFSQNAKPPYIKVRVIEESYLHNPKGKIDWQQSGNFESNFIYFFGKDNDGKWKISDYRKIN